MDPTQDGRGQKTFKEEEVTTWKRRVGSFEARTSSPTCTCRQGKSDCQEDNHVYHHHLERPSVWDCIPVALRGEDGSDTGWESTGECGHNVFQRGRGDHLEKRRLAPLKHGH